VEVALGVGRVWKALEQLRDALHRGGAKVTILLHALLDELLKSLGYRTRSTRGEAGDGRRHMLGHEA
jgi:hypothetical protein